MAVDVEFGGYKVTDWDSVSTLFASYESLANTYSLEMQGFKTRVSGSDVLAFFYYKKTGFNENNLQVLNDQWKTIATNNSITRLPLKVTYT